FGGASSERTAGVLLMRTKGLPDDSAHIPVTFDPSLRLISDTNKFIIELQKTHPKLGSDKLPVIGLVPFSNTLSVPRMSD
ncbi:phosphate acetyltransferase, partial [Escherichia coli]|nr:phosphate acetyltransferase [Escherichia coli]